MVDVIALGFVFIFSDPKLNTNHLLQSLQEYLWR